jgi:hypothetical protein
VARKPELSEDAVTVLALAGTAVDFAGSAEQEVERWLRTLRLYGEAGIVLQAMGVREEPIEERGTAPGAPAAAGGDGESAEGRIANVLTCATDFAVQRNAETVGTVELLLALMRVYGATFDQALELHGTSRLELLERLGIGAPVSAGE